MLRFALTQFKAAVNPSNISYTCNTVQLHSRAKRHSWLEQAESISRHRCRVRGVCRPLNCKQTQPCILYLKPACLPVSTRTIYNSAPASTNSNLSLQNKVHAEKQSVTSYTIESSTYRLFYEFRAAQRIQG